MGSMANHGQVAHSSTPHCSFFTSTRFEFDFHALTFPCRNLYCCLSHCAILENKFFRPWKQASSRPGLWSWWWEHTCFSFEGTPWAPWGECAWPSWEHLCPFVDGPRSRTCWGVGVIWAAAGVAVISGGIGASHPRGDPTFSELAVITSVASFVGSTCTWWAHPWLHVFSAILTSIATAEGIKSATLCTQSKYTPTTGKHFIFEVIAGWIGRFCRLSVPQIVETGLAVRCRRAYSPI